MSLYDEIGGSGAIDGLNDALFEVFNGALSCDARRALGSAAEDRRDREDRRGWPPRRPKPLAWRRKQCLGTSSSEILERSQSRNSKPPHASRNRCARRASPTSPGSTRTSCRPRTG